MRWRKALPHSSTTQSNGKSVPYRSSDEHKRGCKHARAPQTTLGSGGSRAIVSPAECAVGSNPLYAVCVAHFFDFWSRLRARTRGS